MSSTRTRRPDSVPSGAPGTAGSALSWAAGSTTTGQASAALTSHLLADHRASDPGADPAGDDGRVLPPFTSGADEMQPALVRRDAVVGQRPRHLARDRADPLEHRRPVPPVLGEHAGVRRVDD